MVWLRDAELENVEGSGAEVEGLPGEVAEVDEEIGAFGWGQDEDTSDSTGGGRRPWSLPIWIMGW